MTKSSIEATIAPPVTRATAPPLSCWQALETPTQRAAAELYAMGFSIGPTKPASKEPYLWRRLTAARIDPVAIPELFANGAGLFVIVGRISRNLTILDCETDAEAEHHAAEFARRGLSVWVVRTARGKHFWWLSADGELANVPKEKTGGDYELRGHNCYCLCPPSLHPSWAQYRGREFYQWEHKDGCEPPTIPLLALDWLPVTLAKEARRKFEPREAGPLDCLSKRNRDFIANGAPMGTRAMRLLSAACDMQGNEFDYHDARDTLTPPAERCGLTRQEINDILKSAYSKARTPAKENKAARPAPVWARASAWAEAHKWGRMETTKETRSRRAKTATKRYAVSADTARRVWLAVCERARRDHPVEVFRASVREVAELAGVGSRAAYSAILCFVAAGWLKPCHYTALQASLFSFGKENVAKGNSNSHLSLSTVSFCNIRHEAFWRGGLGAIGERVWRLILGEPLKAAEIARRLQVTPATVGRSLARLATWGLATKSAGRLWIGNPADETYLAEVAVKVGTAGLAAKRKERHAMDRVLDITRAILRKKRRWEIRAGLWQVEAPTTANLR